MPFSGGVFTRVHNWVTDKGNSIVITASRMDAEFDGIATALSTALLKDGTQTVTANIPMGSFKFTGLAAGSTAGDSVRYEQVLLLAGGTMSGNIAMGTNKLTGLAAGSTAGDSVRYEQVLLQGKHTIWLPASSWEPDPTSPPALVTNDAGTSDYAYKTYDFDTSSDEILHNTVWMPKSWDASTFTFIVVWENTSAVSTGVAWALGAVSLGDNHDPNTSTGTDVVVTDDAQGTATQWNISGESGAVTVSGAAKSEPVHLRLYRDVSDANDDLAEDAKFVGLALLPVLDAGNDA